MVTVKFTCKQCGLTMAKCFIRDRRKGEHLKQWLEEVGQQVKITHSLLSRECDGDKVDLYIPFDEDKNLLPLSE